MKKAGWEQIKKNDTNQVNIMTETYTTPVQLGVILILTCQDDD